MREQFRRLMKAVNQVEFVFSEIQKSQGKASTLSWLLYVLDDGKSYSQKEIAKDWFMPRSTLNAIVKKAKAEGLIELTPIPHTKRELSIKLTDKGKREAKRLLTPYYEMEDLALQETIEQYSDQFVDVFSQFSNRLEKRVLQGIARLEEDKEWDKNP